MKRFQRLWQEFKGSLVGASIFIETMTTVNNLDVLEPVRRLYMTIDLDHDSVYNIDNDDSRSEITSMKYKLLRNGLIRIPYPSAFVQATNRKFVNFIKATVTEIVDDGPNYNQINYGLIHATFNQTFDADEPIIGVSGTLYNPPKRFEISSSAMSFDFGVVDVFKNDRNYFNVCANHKLNIVIELELEF